MQPPIQPFARTLLCAAALASLGGCATVGSLMSPYSEKFSCKNDDHGQCIHPDRAYSDAVAGIASKSDPKVTNDGALLRAQYVRPGVRRSTHSAEAAPFEGYRDSVYRELKALVDAPVTPMLKPAWTVRTLILPYADRQRPDRLYMPRYVYSVVDKPVWVVAGGLVAAPDRAAQAPMLGQTQSSSKADGDPAISTAAPPSSAPVQEPMP